MKGIQFVVDEHGDKTAVIIDLKKHAQLWEDVYDVMLAESRSGEPRESMEAVKALLGKQAKPNG